MQLHARAHLECLVRHLSAVDMTSRWVYGSQVQGLQPSFQKFVHTGVAPAVMGQRGLVLTPGYRRRSRSSRRRRLPRLLRSYA